MAEATGLGVKLKWDGNYVTDVVTIGPPSQVRDTVDVDSLAPDGDLKRKLVGLIDGGELTATINFDPAVTMLYTDFTNRKQAQCVIEYTGGKSCTFTGTIVGYALQEISSGTVIQAEITITAQSLLVFA